MKTIALAAALALVAVAVPASADPVAVASYYVDVTDSGAQLWEESNGLETLQKEITAGADEILGTEDDVPADTQHL